MGWGAVWGFAEMCGNRFGLAYYLYFSELTSRGEREGRNEANAIQCASYDLPSPVARAGIKVEFFTIFTLIAV
jgi:hypothetical protein